MIGRIILIIAIGVGLALGCESNNKSHEAQKRLDSSSKANLESTQPVEAVKPQIEDQVVEPSHGQGPLEYTFNEPTLSRLDKILIADFNGDGIKDTAKFIVGTQKSGVVLTHGNTNEKLKFGLGNKFEEMGDDFTWVDSWGVLIDSITYEIVIEDSEIKGDTIIALQNPAIVLKNKEDAGGLIAFRNGKYEWVHQAD